MNVEFLDTNVLVYAFSDEPGKQPVASALVERIALDRNGALSTQTLIEFYSVATRKLKLSPRVAVNALENFRSWRIYSLSFEDILESSRLQERHKISFWDAMIVNSATESGAHILWTEDLNDGQRFGDLVIRNPFTQ